jgi:tetratricopeptide (TPR) repeat protein
MSAPLEAVLAHAQAARNAGQWAQAIRLFGQAAQIRPDSFEIRHNLALCHFGAGKLDEALIHARDAVRIKPDGWQSLMIEAKVHRAKGRIVETSRTLDLLLAIDPKNGSALTAMADIELNEFGDPAAAADRVEPLRRHPTMAADAELTSMMAELYLGTGTAEAISDRLKAFSRARLRITPVERPARSKRARKDRKSTRLNSSHRLTTRMPSSA